MKIILSPAKSLYDTVKVEGIEPSQILFTAEVEKLIANLQKLSQKQIAKLMHISDDLAALNYNRFQHFSREFTLENSSPAGLLFSGAAYQGLDYASMTLADQKEGNKRLRILSGLYGLLRPFDLIQPYRLEMGTSLKVTPKTTNLYKFWGDKIQKQLQKELQEEGSNLLVNVASSEYFKAAQLKEMSGIEIITPVFKDLNKNGEFKVNMTYAKQARGMMTRFIIENKIDKSEEIKGFDIAGYGFDAANSDKSEFVFNRTKKI